MLNLSKHLKRVLLAIALIGAMVFGVQKAANAESATCQGEFPNPITDFCWSCVFPIKVGSAAMFSFGQEDNNSDPGGFFCYCRDGIKLKLGLRTSFWEPARLVESVRHPFCFPTLGGQTLNFGFDAPSHGRSQQGSATKGSFYQVHWYINPLLFWLEVLMDNSCLEQNAFDLGYFTEVDPLWDDSEITFILNPEVAIFANIPSQAACAADCVAASAGFPLNQLFWCAGCQGSMYPLNGHVGAHTGGVQASFLTTQRMTAKMHREGLIWAASGEAGLCSYYMQPTMDKTYYKAQLVSPKSTNKVDGKCCQPYGRTTAITGAGKEQIYVGEDFSWQIFRKRNCCAGASPY